MKKILFPFFSLILLFACGQKNNVQSEAAGAETSGSLFSDNNYPSADTTVVTMTVEDSLLNMIMSIPEVEEYGRMVEKRTDGKHGAASIITPPNDDEPRYLVTVGVNHDDHFEPAFFFYVDLAMGDIWVMHLVTGQEYMLKDWQVRNHRYKNGDLKAFEEE